MSTDPGSTSELEAPDGEFVLATLAEVAAYADVAYETVANEWTQRGLPSLPIRPDVLNEWINANQPQQPPAAHAACDVEVEDVQDPDAE